MMITGNANTNAPMYGLVFTNNLMVTGRIPGVGRGRWHQQLRLKPTCPITTITNCFTTYTFSNNALVATPTGVSAVDVASQQHVPANRQ